MGANVEIITPGQGMPMILGGSVGKRLLANGMDPNCLKPYMGKDGRAYVTKMYNGKAVAVPAPYLNATLRTKEWIELDTALVQAAEDRLVGVASLYSKNLVYRIGNGLGKTVLEYEDIDQLSAAEMTMDAITRSTKDRPNYELKYLPLPIVHKDFSFNVRVLAASRTTGQPIDVTTGILAARQVAEKIETILFQGASSYAYGGGTLYGYLDHPNKNSVTLSQNWDASGKTGAEILDDVLSMKQASIDALHQGPWELYVPTGYETVLDNDYDTSTPGTTIRERIMKIGGIQDIKVADKCTANKVVLAEMRPETVRIVEGMAITTLEWDEGGGFSTNYKVMTIMVPQIRADQNGNCGITVLSA